MDTIQIPCPKCGRELKLRDRNLLGRKGKCPKCNHAFILEEPAEVQLELAESDPGPLEATTEWAPNRGKPAATAARTATTRQPSLETLITPAIPELNGFVGSTDGAAARLKAMQKKNAKRRNVGLAVGVVVLSAVGGITYYAMTNVPLKPVLEQVDVPAAREAIADEAKTEVATNGLSSPSASPTKGKPIELQYIPYGTQIILNIRPAALWKNDGPGQEFRYCIPPLAKLLEEKFMELFKRKPEQIEEAQICIIPGTLGTMPEIAAVIHLVDEAKKSQLLEDFGGERIDDFGHPVYVSGNTAYLIADQKTIAMGPKTAAKEMVDAITERSLTSDGIDELLPMTDRERHVTFVFVPRAIRQHASWWFPDNLKPFVLSICNWFGDEVEAVAWSFHLGDKNFYSELLMRNVTGITSSRLERETRAKLDKLPREILSTIKMMKPREMGKRKVIGRVPKMSESYALASTVHHGPRHVQIVTPLPERAAPNLALGTILAWDESTRTDFTKAAPKTTPSDEQKLPDLIVDRLKLKMDAEYSRTAFWEAFKSVSDEIKTRIDIDGDALKAGGFTKNMPQTFKLDKAPAQEVIAKILEKYQDPKKPSNTIVVVIDQDKKTILITTQAFAEQKNMTMFDVFKK